MEESEDNISSEEINYSVSPSLAKMKTKKRSIVERELETSLTTRVTSPVINGEATSTSRYGRARKLKSETEVSDLVRLNVKLISPKFDKSPNRQVTAYKMYASNSPIKNEVQLDGLDNQIENIITENRSLSRFGSNENKYISPAKKQPKIYIRKDLIQTKEKDDELILIKNMFSPVQANKKSDTKSSEKNNFILKKARSEVDFSSIVKTLDFGNNKKKKKDSAEKRLSQSDLFALEAQCAYQVGDLAWARMGTYPFWPCVVTREPASMMFVKQKLYGRLEKGIIHVTFLGDNGRRSWILETMLRKYLGLHEFEAARDQFTSAEKKKDPRLYAAFLISEKRSSYWYTSVEEAEVLLKEPKRLRIDSLNAMLNNAKNKAVPAKSKKVARTNSDVSLSESLYDSLFSEDDCKNSDSETSRSKSKNKSFDVSDVVTACLDNMAAKTGITKIQKQSHMDRWLQKAKSSTPEKSKLRPHIKLDKKDKINNSKKILSNDHRRHSLRNCTNESENNKLLSHYAEHNYSQNSSINGRIIIDELDLLDSASNLSHESSERGSGIGIISKVETLAGQDTMCNNESNNLAIEPDAITPCNDEESTEIEVITNEDIAIESYDIDVFTKLNQEKNNRDNINDKQFNHDKNNESIITESCENNIAILSENQKLTNLKENIIGTITTTTSDLQNISNMSTKNCDVYENITNDVNIDALNNETSNKGSSNRSHDMVSHTTPKGLSIVEDDRSNIVNSIESELVFKNTKDDNIENQSLILKKYDNTSSESDTKNAVKLKMQNKLIKENIGFIVEENNGVIENAMKDNVKENLAQNDTLNTPIQTKNFELNSNNSRNNTQDDIQGNDGLNISNEILNKEVPEEEFCLEKSEGSKGSFDLNAKTTENNCIIPKRTTINRTEAQCEYNNLDNDGLESKKMGNQYTEVRGEIKLPKGSAKKGVFLEKDNYVNDSIENENVCNVNALVENCKIQNQSSAIHEAVARNNKLDDSKAENAYLNLNFSQESDIERSGNSQNVNTEDDGELTSANNHINNTSFIDVNGIKSIEFLKYVEQKQDAVLDEHPELSPKEITDYLYKTWQYEESLKTDRKKLDDIEQSNLIKGLKTSSPSVKKSRKRTLHLKSSKNKQNIINSNVVPKVNKIIKKIEDTKCVKNNTYSNDSNNIHKQQDQALNTENEMISESINQDDKPVIKASSLSVTEKTFKTDTEDDTTAKNNEIIEGNQLDTKNNDHWNQGQASNDENDTVPESFNSKQQDSEESYSGTFCEEPSSTEIQNENVQEENDSIDSNVNCDSNSNLNSTESACGTSRTTCSSISIEENNKKQDLPKDETDVMSVDDDLESSETFANKRRLRALGKTVKIKPYQKNPEFLKYLELRQDALIDEHPELTLDKIAIYLYNTWLYEESTKTDRKKTDDIEQANLVKGLNHEIVAVKRVRQKKEKEYFTNGGENVSKDKSKRRTADSQYYKEDFSDNEDDLELFDIFKTKPRVDLQTDQSKEPSTNKQVKDEHKEKKGEENIVIIDKENAEFEQFNQVEEYFRQLTETKPNLFKGLIREKVCEICERVGNLVKCKSCHGMFHVDCTKKVVEVIGSPQPIRGRKKKRKNRGRKPKGLDDSNDDHSDDKFQDPNNSEEIHDYESESHTIANADEFEAKLSAKLKEMVENAKYDSNSSYEELNWSDTDVGKCEVVDILPRKKKIEETNQGDFKCKNCEQYRTPMCFVCKSAVSPKRNVEHIQKCQVAHCNQYYHLECLEHWPQAQYNSGEARNKKTNEHFEALFCPRHVCHTCVCDDPRGCKTRFSGDKLARCVRCPATYHTFTKCLPAGTQILTGSHIICPRHYEHRPGKVPCHVNTGWCFICALGGSLICCEYCPTSFHAECLNIKPPEGGYMCEDCETGCLPLYGKMVWVKLGHYRWWPGLILHPLEIPENILAVKHYAGEFVVRFFGQYDHYWVNRGRVFPFQEGDTGKISSKNSKIDAAFAMAVEHAQRAYEIIKNASHSNEGDEIASSLLPPHYVKLKVNRPLGSLAGRRTEEEGSYTQCECNPADAEPCGPYSHCLNRMLLTECGPMCRAGDRCHNRAFEKRLYPRLEPYRTPSRGWGLRALEDVRAGQFVIEYVGEVIDEEEFQRRMKWKHEVRDENYYFLTLDKERMIDAGPKGNLARFMNHSCEPNCETQKWTVLGDVRVGLFAINDIPANSELTFNYNLECAGIEKKRCMCGTKRCSGFMGAKPKQDESHKKKLPVKRTYKKRKPIELSPTMTQSKTKRGRPKNRELTEIEKDLLIIASATNGVSSDSESSGRLNSVDSVNSLKRKRLHEEGCNGLTSPSAKKTKHDHKSYEID